MSYWRLVRLDGTGKRRVEEVEIAKAFFQTRFAAEATSDAFIQRDLLQLLRTGSANQQQAEICLRCFISQQIEQVCVQLERRFGAQHGFTRYDLFPFVLDDDLRVPCSSVSMQYRPLACEILQTFNADRAGLSTWVSRQVRHHPELRVFLQEHGVYLATDWSILNDTSPELLRSVMSEFYDLTAAEVLPACELLQAYHQVYRQDRLEQRRSGHLTSRAVCAAPTSDQLMRMSRCLPEQGLLSPPPERLLSQLQTIASQLRQYRLHRVNRTSPTEPLEQPGREPILAEPIEPEIDPEEDAFLRSYREQILTCLDQALVQAIEDRVTYLQRRQTKAAAQFLTALKLFYCQGQTMSDIAPQVGRSAQYQVTRLLKLGEFRANVRSRLLQLLLRSVLDIAASYADPPRLQQLNRQIESILEEQINTLMQQAETESAVARQRTSLFARRLCHYLDQHLD
ncbi:hypothetical protein IFO70_35555 [Phormidium tenue FACHB-886]|nr:hypothetical protein [Phormidium tenue FACHB-886]